MSRKTVPFTKDGIAKLPNDRPVVYKIVTEGGRNNYTGIAERGRVRDRLAEHLPDARDHVPGAKVQIEQMSNIEAARSHETNIIKHTKPRYNKQGK